MVCKPPTGCWGVTSIGNLNLVLTWPFTRRCAVPNVSDGRWDRCHVRQNCYIGIWFQVLCNSNTCRFDNRNTDCDYSSAYVSLYTNTDLVGHGMTFTIGRGNDIVSFPRPGGWQPSMPASFFWLAMLIHGNVTTMLIKRTLFGRYVWQSRLSQHASLAKIRKSFLQTWERPGIGCLQIPS